MENKYNIIADTREKLPYTFQVSDWCSGLVTRGLKTGDYSLEGFEDRLAIERKRSTSEVATNLFESRFPDVLSRLNAMQFPFIICEFEFSDIGRFPEGSGIPRSKWPYLKVTGPLITKTLTNYMLDYPNIKWLFFNGREAAQAFVRQLFKRVIEHG